MKVVVGVDLSLDRGPNWLVERAVALCSRLQATLDLVYIGAGSTHEARLETLLKTVPKDVRGEARILAGDPAEVLVRLTRHADAIVIGPRDPPGLEKLYLNPMAVRVLRQSWCPVYVPRCDRLGTGPTSMLLGVDLRSTRLPWVLEHTNTWARALDAKVHIVHAIPRSLPPVRRPELRKRIEDDWQRDYAETLHQVEALLEHIDHALRGTARIVPGEAEDALLDLSAEHQMVVVGNRDRKGLERFLLGGVARVVVTRAQSDVLVLPTQRVTSTADA